MTVAIEPVKKGEEEKLAQALHQLREEDPTLIVEVSQELKQTLMHCQGDMHLAVAKWKIENIHKLPVKFVSQRLPTGKPFGKWRKPITGIKNNRAVQASLVKYICV